MTSARAAAKETRPAASKFKSSNCTSSSNYVNSLRTYCQKLTNQNFAAAGGRRNEKVGVFVAGVTGNPSSLPPSPSFFSPVLAPLSPPHLRLLRRLHADCLANSSARACPRVTCSVSFAECQNGGTEWGRSFARFLHFLRLHPRAKNAFDVSFDCEATLQEQGWSSFEVPCE